MLVLVLLGMMNLAWMALVATVVSAERLLRSGRIVAAVAAAALRECRQRCQNEPFCAPYAADSSSTGSA